ncbi:hypothetical protein [Kitasatospora cineracea]|uniref:hypothetical protein n=1 Tax=Kitasatospora cineracea TaxID=88074 RepID=UPI0033E734B4
MSGAVSPWRYEVWRCDCGYNLPEEHDGSCGIWVRVNTFSGGEWIQAYEAAAELPHGRVGSFYQPEDGPEKGPVLVYEHVAGGGLCAGCWRAHQNTHTQHELDENTGMCGPCAAVQGRRGPLTRIPGGMKEFMCEPCRIQWRAMHERARRSLGQDPDPRLYRDALTTAREDAQQL